MRISNMLWIRLASYLLAQRQQCVQVTGLGCQVSCPRLGGAELGCAEFITSRHTVLGWARAKPGGPASWSPATPNLPAPCPQGPCSPYPI